MTDDSRDPRDPGDARSEQRSPKVFISYRHMDTTPGDARTLKKEIGARLGLENVFVDDDIPEGDRWKDVIEQTIASAHILVVLIGAYWVNLGREKRAEDDIVRLEIRTAVRSGLRIVPVLVDDTRMPRPDELPLGIDILPDFDALELRHSREDDDLKAIVERIMEIGAEIASGRSPQPERGGLNGAVIDGAIDGAPAPPPGAPADHYKDVAMQLMKGKVVICLGWDVNAGGLEDSDGQGCARADDELAAGLASLVEPAQGDSSIATLSTASALARVSQQVSLKAPSDLYEELGRLLTDNCRPTPIHRFLAQLPQALRAHGSKCPYALIVTTSYDDALEQAFRDAAEEYDLAIYLARGASAGKFLHVPYGGAPRVIDTPNEEQKLPIDSETKFLERTVIVKIHGAVDRPRGLLPVEENYVVTENDYIDYLSRDKIGNYIPVQILNKLRCSRALFLGYPLGEWNLRVFVQRVWGAEGGFQNASWAVRSSDDPVEPDFWERLQAKFFDYPVDRYVSDLASCLDMAAPAPVST